MLRLVSKRILGVASQKPLPEILSLPRFYNERHDYGCSDPQRRRRRSTSNDGDNGHLWTSNDGDNVCPPHMPTQIFLNTFPYERDEGDSDSTQKPQSFASHLQSDASSFGSGSNNDSFGSSGTQADLDGDF